MNISTLNFHFFLKFPEGFLEQAVAHDLDMSEKQQNQKHIPN